MKIWIKRGKRGVMDEVSEVLAEEDRGLESNANRGGRRQVTLLEKEKWDRMMQRLDANLDPSTRRANLLIEGVDLFDSRGRTIEIGDCRIEICGETRP